MENKDKDLDINIKKNNLKNHLRNHKNFKNNQKTFFIYMIFIKYHNKKAIINELEKLKLNGHLKGNMNEFYKTFKQLVIPLGKIYILINQKLKSSNKLLKLSKKSLKLSKKTSKNLSKKTKKIGGFLFMLERKKDKAITGNDITNMLNKYEKSMQLIYYTKYGQDGTVTSPSGEEMTVDIANPLTALKTILDFSRGKPKDGLTDQAPTFMKTLQNMDLSEVANAGSYYSLYKLYMEEFKKKEPSGKIEPGSGKEQLMSKIKKGPPKEPGSIKEPVLGQKKFKRTLSSFNKSHPVGTEFKKYVGIYNKNIK